MNVQKKIILGASILAGIATSTYYSIKRVERIEQEGIEFSPVGLFVGLYDVNKDGMKDYLVVIPSVSNFSVSDGKKQLGYFDGTKVSAINNNNCVRYELNPTPIDGTEFTAHKGNYDECLPVVVNDLGELPNGTHNLKISEITPDFPITLDKIVNVK
jgi:hypothetical protein